MRSASEVGKLATLPIMEKLRDPRGCRGAMASLGRSWETRAEDTDSLSPKLFWREKCLS